MRFKDLTYDLAPMIYEYPITTPAQFTYLMRALMTLEGVSIVMNPDFNFFDVARPYVKDFIFRRESRSLRRMALESLRDAGTGRFELGPLMDHGKDGLFALFRQRLMNSMRIPYVSIRLRVCRHLHFIQSETCEPSRMIVSVLSGPVEIIATGAPHSSSMRPM